MNKKQAFKLITKCVEYYIHKKLSVNANLHELGYATGSQFKRDFEERKKIDEALKIFENLCS